MTTDWTAWTKFSYDLYPGKDKPESCQSMQLVKGVLEALYNLYQEAHWTASGPAYYGQHLLFQRLYEGIRDEVDEVAEKMVQMFGPLAVESSAAAELVASIVSSWSEDEENRVVRALEAEEDFQGVLEAAYQQLEEDGLLTMGFDDWIMARSNSHETHMYLLQQTLKTAQHQAFTIPPMESGKGLKPTAPREPDDIPRGASDEEEDVLPLLPPSVSPELTSLEKSWGGYSSFRPNRRAAGWSFWTLMEGT